MHAGACVCVCVCACVCVCVRAVVRVCMRVCGGDGGKLITEASSIVIVILNTKHSFDKDS